MLAHDAGAQSAENSAPPAENLLPAAEDVPPPAGTSTVRSLASGTVVLDCRWLGLGGAGRVTELLLAEFREVPPPGTWLLWGSPARLDGLTFAGSQVVPWTGDPKGWFGQADLWRVPRGDVVIYLHQLRPLRPGTTITFVHDTIPVQFERRRPVRALKSLFFRAVCALSARIVTVSMSSKDAIVRDLRIPASKIAVTTLGIDPARAARIRELRAHTQRVDEVLFVGRFAVHKNLERLCRAFQRTAFQQAGGRLVLVGGAPAETARLSAWVRREMLSGMDVRGACPEAELDQLLATCRALVLPSLAEGYGLPAVEAAAAGVQVALSNVGCAPEIPVDRAVILDPMDERSITAAIDEAVRRPNPDEAWTPPSTLAADVVAAVAHVLRVT